MSLFDNAAQEATRRSGPLPHRMRPETLDQFVGQRHLLDPGRPLGELIRRGVAFSALFAGPPGTGKTTLARLVSRITRCAFVRLNAVTSKVSDLREHLAAAARRLGATGERTVLFIDELHRFNRAQQDALLPDLEEGRVYLLATTTENPSFVINAPILSRLRVFHFRPLEDSDVLALLRRGCAVLGADSPAVGETSFEADDEALAALAAEVRGDARQGLMLLQMAHDALPRLDLPALRALVAEGGHLAHDRQGDQHYDLASAFIKSMRGSDPDAAVYYLARLIEAGEPPRFVARRIMIAASEEVGNADPTALILAESAASAADMVGFPEAKLILAQAALYVACAPKSNATTLALSRAIEDVHKGPRRDVPLFLRNKPPLGLSPDEPYRYPHDAPEGFVPQAYLAPPARFYEPKHSGREVRIGQRLAEWRRLRAEAARRRKK